MSENKFKKTDLKSQLLDLGLQKGATVMCHSSLSSIGKVEDGARGLVETILEILGPEGTLVAPTFTIPIANDPKFIFDQVKTPSYMGAISECVRKWPGSVRNYHPRHSIAAIGYNALEICSKSSYTAWGESSPMSYLMHNDAEILLIGVSYQHITFFHLCEIEMQVPYRIRSESKRKIKLINDNHSHYFSFEVFRPLKNKILHYDFNRIGRDLELSSSVSYGPLGKAAARLISSKKLNEHVLSNYKHNKNYLFGETMTELTFGKYFKKKNNPWPICVIE